MNCDAINGHHQPDCECFTEPMFYIQCASNYAYDYILWWRPNRQGYTHNLSEAGLYSEWDARHICDLRGEEVAWPRHAAEAATDRAVNIYKIQQFARPAFDGTGKFNAEQPRSRPMKKTKDQKHPGNIGIKP